MSALQRIFRGRLAISVLMAGMIVGFGTFYRGQTADLAVTHPMTGSVFEYAVIHWDGRDNTHVIYKGGRHENLGPQFQTLRAPRNVDERSYFLTLAMNALAEKGFEFSGTLDHNPVMRRPAQ